MDIKFPKPEHELRKTVIQFLIGVAIAAAVGCLLGSSVGAFLGTDESFTVSTAYTDRLSAAKSMFLDEEDSEHLQMTAAALVAHDGWKVLRSADGDPVVEEDGSQCAPEDVLSADDSEMLRDLFGPSNTLSSATDSSGVAITDMKLYNIAVHDNQVWFYVYYDDYGYIAVVYDENDTLSNTTGAIALMQDQTTQKVNWYLMSNCKYG